MKTPMNHPSEHFKLVSPFFILNFAFAKSFNLKKHRTKI